MSHPATKFLSSQFDGQPIGLIAGKGYYPILMAQRLLSVGLPLRLIAFEGETEAALINTFKPDQRASIKVGQLGMLLKALTQLGCAHAVMAGQITPKRLFHGLHPDLKILAVLNQLKVRNAETIFGAIAREIESINIQMLDARLGLDDQLASPGLMTPGKLKVPPEYLQHGIKIAEGAAELDIGQGCVVRKGTVLAVEAYEGTDPMLQRAGSFKTDDLIFVKTVKRAQDYRFDVPVFGERTLDMMQASGIQTAALKAGSVILLDKDKLIEAASIKGIQLFGF
ncbi:MAG: Uncharacterised protein [Opitutia bacterium UBA7350]|nr:MAG: Uncharacterised protein [Opitutae bacterium UBA7350]